MSRPEITIKEAIKAQERRLSALRGGSKRAILSGSSSLKVEMARAILAFLRAYAEQAGAK